MKTFEEYLQESVDKSWYKGFTRHTLVRIKLESEGLKVAKAFLNGFFGAWSELYNSSEDDKLKARYYINNYN